VRLAGGPALVAGGSVPWEVTARDWGARRIRSPASSWDSPGGLRQAGIPCPPRARGQGGEGKPGWAGPAHRADPAGRLTREAAPGPPRRMTPGERSRPYA